MVKPEIRLFALAALFAVFCAVAGVAAAGAPAPMVNFSLKSVVLAREILYNTITSSDEKL